MVQLNIYLYHAYTLYVLHKFIPIFKAVYDSALYNIVKRYLSTPYDEKAY